MPAHRIVQPQRLRLDAAGRAGEGEFLEIGVGVEQLAVIGKAIILDPQPERVIRTAARERGAP